MKKIKSALEKEVVQSKAAGSARRGRISGICNRSRKSRQRSHVPLIFSKRGEGYIDVCVLILCAILVIALAVKVLPVFIAKQQLDTYATELCREAEISGRVGSETSRRAAVLTEQTGLSPRISWSKTGSIQLNEEITVTLTLERNLGLFGSFGSFPITLRSQASGKSEVYHK